MKLEWSRPEEASQELESLERLESYGAQERAKPEF
jgi:hypothetical protein